METIFRQKASHRLTKEQFQAKLKKDSEYEIAVQNLSTAFYQKKRTIGVSEKEEGDYLKAKSKLWNDYKNWAIGAGLYEEITPEQQLAEAEMGLDGQLKEVNLIRAELGKPKKKLIEEL